MTINWELRANLAEHEARAYRELALTMPHRTHRRKRAMAHARQIREWAVLYRAKANEQREEG